MICADVLRLLENLVSVQLSNNQAMISSVRSQISTKMIGGADTLNAMLRVIANPSGYVGLDGISMTLQALAVAKSELRTSPYGIGETLQDSSERMKEGMGLLGTYLGMYYLTYDAQMGARYDGMHQGAFRPISYGGQGSGNKTLLSGEEWYKYFQETYGAQNVTWKATSFEHILKYPEILYGASQAEVAKILGEGWTVGTYGSAGVGWKFTKGDLSVFYHPGGGIHGGSYYGFSSGITGKVKVVGDGYIPTIDDNATVIKIGK